MRTLLFLKRLFQWGSVGVVVAAFTQESNGAAIAYHATGSITSSDYPSGAAVGDRFSLDFSYDDAVVDTDPRTTFGYYPAALRSLSFHLIPGESSGSFAGGSTSNQTVLIQPDDFRLDVHSGVFAPFGGYPVALFFVFFDDFTATNTIFDPGGVSTLGQVLHDAVELSEFRRPTIELVTDNGKTGMRGNITSMTVVPEPSVLVLLALGLIAPQRRRMR